MLNKSKESLIDPKLAKYYQEYLIKENIYNEKLYQKGLKKLKKGFPIQYIIGNVNFYGNIITVNKSVLIPRFETEQLIEKTIKHIKNNLNKKNINIVDLGTGSGCIAITLKKEIPTSIVDAVDISKKALKVAMKNAKNNNVNINFYHGNMLNPLKNKYDVIISNPPYIDKNEIIEDIVKNNEPHLALYAKKEGLEYYQSILSSSSKYLNMPSIIAFEIGNTQGLKIFQLAKKYFPNSKIIIEKDYSNKDRFIFVINE